MFEKYPKQKHRKDDELRINRFGLITMCDCDCEITENSKVVKAEKKTNLL